MAMVINQELSVLFVIDQLCWDSPSIEKTSLTVLTLILSVTLTENEAESPVVNVLFHSDPKTGWAASASSMVVLLKPSTQTEVVLV